MSGSGKKTKVNPLLSALSRLESLTNLLSSDSSSSSSSSPPTQKKAKGLRKSSSQSAFPVPREMEPSEGVSVGVAASSSSLNSFICESEESRAPTPAKPESRLTDLQLLINEKAKNEQTEAKTRRDTQKKDNINEKMYKLLVRALLHLNEEYTNPTDDMGRKKGLQTFIITLLKSYPSMMLTDADWKDIERMIRAQDLESLYSELTALSNPSASKSSSSSPRLFQAAPEYPVLPYLTQWHASRAAPESSSAPSK